MAMAMVYRSTTGFASYSAVVLGLALGVAPAGTWIAIRASLEPRILWLTAAVTFWTAGFDIIYSCQDYEFDKATGLFSIPGRFGIAGSLWIARVLHTAMVACLILLALRFPLCCPSLLRIQALST